MPYNSLQYNAYMPGYTPLRFEPGMDQNQAAQMPQGSPSPAAQFPTIDPKTMQAPQIQSQGPHYEMKSKWQFGLNPEYRAFSDTVQGIGAFFANRKNQEDALSYQRAQNNPLTQLPQNPNTSQQSLYGSPELKSGGWIKKAINPSHKGWCTPLSNPHCTGHRRALALRFKHHKLGEGGDTTKPEDPKYLAYVYPGDTNKRLIINTQAQTAGINADTNKPNFAYNYKSTAGKSGTISQAEYQEILSNIKNKSNIKNGILYSDGMKEAEVLPWTNFGSGGQIEDFNQDDIDEMRDLKEEMEDKLAGLNSQTNSENQDTSQNEPEAPQQDEEQIDNSPIPEDQGAAESLLNESSDTSEPDQDQDDTSNDNSTAEIPSHLLNGNEDNPLLQAFKNGIANVEGAGYNVKNKNSSAFGKYQITDGTREGIRKQFFSKINKLDFDNAYKTDPKFQERVMDVYSSHLLGSYTDPHQAAIAYFLGEGKANKVNEPSYRPTPNNATVGQYLKGFDKGYKFKEGGTYDLTSSQIAILKRQGYQIETI